jgi:hypothetical protein
VELILNLSALRTPITVSQGLHLANSLIKSMKVKKFVMDWKSRNCHAFKVASKCGKEKITLSLGYWRSFMEWNMPLTRAKKELNLTISGLSGVITLTLKKCMRKYTKISALLGTPVSIQSLYGEAKMEMLLSPRRIYLD